MRVFVGSGAIALVWPCLQRYAALPLDHADSIREHPEHGLRVLTRLRVRAYRVVRYGEANTAILVRGATNRALGYLCCPSGSWLSAPRTSIMRTSVPESVAVQIPGIQALNAVAESGW